MIKYRFFIGLIFFQSFVFAQTSNLTKPADQVKPQSGDTTVAVTYSRQFNKMNYKMEDCLAKAKYDICLKLKKQKKDENRPLELLAAAQKACELKPQESCTGLFTLARQIGGNSLASTQKVLESVCLKHAEACDEVSSFYEELKDYNSAISFARKYYLKFQKGSFARISYNYGDKNEAFAASVTVCEKDISTCAEFLRLMPDHPHLDKLIKGAEKACSGASRSNLNAGSCIAVGLHYYNLENSGKAYDAWSKECDLFSPTACFYIMGGTFEIFKKQISVSKFCRIPPAYLNANQLNLQKNNCIGKSDKMTTQLEAVGQFELRSLLTAGKEKK